MRTLPRAAIRQGVARGLLASLVGSALLAGSFAAPAAAAPRAIRGDYAPHAKHQLKRGHIASATVAARAAVHAPRATVARQAPHPSVKIAHPARPASLRSTSHATLSPRIVGPDLTVAAQFDGLTQGESGDVLPPDPWVAVNASYVVQVVNSMVRVSNRAGGGLQTFPTWLLFGLTPDQFESDGRIIWDATHARWVGVALSFNETETSNFLYLIVSDGADPTAGWATYAFDFGSQLPDFPSIASSTDKIVLTDDTFDLNAPSFLGGEIITVTWSSVILGSPSFQDCISDTLAHPRAAQVLSSTADVHLIEESTADAEQVYYRVAGTGTCDTNGFKDGTDLGFAFASPPDPRQTADDTIGTDNGAVDERPTDAVWQNNHLWWVSTYPITYDGGTTFNDGVVVWTATTAAIGAPTTGDPTVVSAADGIDDFMGGIGLTRNGTLMISYSESSSSDPVSLWVNQVPPGGLLGTPTRIDVSDASYPRERWGDFAGVAMDPVGTGSAWATHEVAAEDGSWRTDVVRLVVDADSPSLPGIAAASIAAPTTLSRSVPVRFAWGAATDVSSNVAKYQVGQSIDSGPYVDIGNVSGASMIRQLLGGHTYKFEVRAVDAVGNVGGWRESSPFNVSVPQSTTNTTYTGSWGTALSSLFSGGSTRWSSTAGATATFSASARSIAIVATRATTRGSFRVYVDGVLRATVSSSGTPTIYRRVLYQYAWSVPGTHKVKIVILATAGHPRVDLDAFVVLH